MENSCNNLVLHPRLLEVLFAFKSKVTNVFKDVMGLHEIHHVSITHISPHNKTLILSSTPSMEFNLFNGPLWKYDETYSPKWFTQLTQAYWQTLYKQVRYDELYYVKQIKHALPLGLSLAAKLNENYVIYSLASHNDCEHTREVFTTHQEDLYKIGQYCSTRLSPIFEQVDYETSK